MSVDTGSSRAAAKPELVEFTIDGQQLSVPKGTLVIRAAEMIGIGIPRFCDHPLLDPVAACRQCLVEVPDAGNGRPMKPQPACALVAMPGMQVETAASNATVAKHQEGMLEFLLINHPLDCPICDKGGECPLQNQAMSHGPGESRYEGVKRTFPKPVHISAEILLDRERCVLCQRCTRFSTQISGDEFIELAERGALSQIKNYEDTPYQSYFAGNIVQICPVGALTSADYRFQSRPFDLVSTTSSCEHCADGCELRIDHRAGTVRRRMAGDDPQVNEEWNCDRGRFGFRSTMLADRLTSPLVRREGVLEPASWPEAIDAAARGLARAGHDVGVLPGGRLTVENAYAYSRFTRAVLGSNDIDFRSRPASAEESAFLASYIAGRRFEQAVHYADLEAAARVVLVSLEPEDESPIVFLRLRKAWRAHGLQIVNVAPFNSAGATKLGARLHATAPGGEADALRTLAADGLLDEQTIVLIGERAALSPGALATAAELTKRRGARLAWIPRRAGEVGAIEAGALPALLPAGRQVADPGARVDLAAAWGVASLPATTGREVNAIIEAAGNRQLQALVTAGIQAEDFLDPRALLDALESVDFVVSLEQRRTEVTERADVVFPVAPITEQVGHFINWEHRIRPVQLVIDENPSPMTDVRVLAALADAMGADLGMRSPAQARAEFAQIADWSGERAHGPIDSGGGRPVTSQPPAPDSLVLAGWRLLIDDAAGLDGATELLATAPARVARLAPADAARLGLVSGDPVEISGPAGRLVAPVELVGEMSPGVVWLPLNTGSSLFATLGAHPGDRVHVTAPGSRPDGPNQSDGGAQ
ncbi:NADH-quinone oxidoreductase subunit G [Propionibacterium cyclohexanicum]|uniref:NADH-quinone oxidoreductase n=1 Tax=Propionibacterium cyclohexanicum TaxID=64702 RepID=A0A1H9TB17_9ACTN|nr:NADH-quinone oxidoreductase subunit G [Propionibacterium cyclohexanicum]SER93969.1 NADH-quinone oxidoreductase subunit G [Propionibacterium cyclohexanicum]